MLRFSDSSYGVYRDGVSHDRNTANPLEEFIIMLVVLGFAAAIRLWKLGDWSFWADEVFSVQDAQKFPGQLMINPIAYVIVRAFTDIFGISEWSARLGPCIIGIISVPLLYWPARRMFGARTGAIACLFLVFHPWHIYWSQNARAYSLVFLFASYSAFLFYLALERDSFGLTIASLFMALLSIFTYPQSAMLVLALLGYVISFIIFPAGIPRGLNGRNLITFFAPFVLALAGLLLPPVREYILSGWGMYELGRSPLYILLTLVYCLGIPMAVAAFVGGIHSLVYMNRSGVFMICYSAIPLLILLIVSPFLNVAGYYLFFTMPAYLFLAAFCASELVESISRRSKVLSVAVILIVLVALISQDYLYFTVENGGRPKWRESLQSLKHRVGLDDIVVVSMPRIAEYYLWNSSGESVTSQALEKLDQKNSNLAPPNARGARSELMPLEDVIQQLGTLESQWRRKDQSIWFVLDQLSLDSLDADHRFRNWLYINCNLVEEFPVYARVKDRTISIWSVTYTKSDVSDEFFEDFIF